MEASLTAFVRRRARHVCEYCRFPEAEANLAFWIDHVRARQHAGPDTADNLALACPFCNLHKGPNISGFDAVTNAAVLLFNPRKDAWSDHFR